MKKNLLTILGCLAFSTVFAQTDLPRVEVFTPYGEVKDSIPGSNVQGVSLNGEWAVGFGTEYSQHSFIWNRTTGEYSLITGSYEDLSYAYGVSNDGTVVGAFYEDTEGNGGLGYMLPGIWKDGVWTKLQMENTFVPTEGLEASVNGEACFISGDGAVITGYIQSTSFKRNFYDASGALVETRNVSLMRPAVWTKQSNGTYKLQRKPSTMPTGDELQQGIWSRYGSSQDGTVISVVADHPSGSRSPGVVINGELTRIYGKEDIDVNSDETQYFYDGVSVTVSPNGKYVPGYWSATGSGFDLQAFVYDTETETVEELEGWGAATVAFDDGSIFGFDGYMGNALYRNADKSYNGSFSDYLNLYYGGYEGNLPQTILSASGDGKTIGGWYAEADAIGAVMYPSIVVLNGAPNAEPDHVAEWKNDQRTIIVLGDEVIAPMAVKVELYSAQGALLNSVSADRIALNGLQGVVIAKATYEDGKVEIKKVAVK
ncbi:MAG: hypothetical protein J6K05_02950 [Bacteroidaceae bacterium]|nr:hypothetical protein [Bacteroidaceae bacterium]